MLIKKLLNKLKVWQVYVAAIVAYLFTFWWITGLEELQANREIFWTFFLFLGAIVLVLGGGFLIEYKTMKKRVVEIL